MNRGKKTVRNLALCALLGALVYTMLGFPPYTVRGMLDRVERLYFLSDLEPVLVEKGSMRYDSDFFAHHTTYLIARTGDTYVSADFTRHGLEVWPQYRRNLAMSRDALCTGANGTLYVAGNFAEAASASVEVTAQRTTRTYDPETEEYELTLGEQKTFAYPGEKVSDDLLSFYYREEDPDTWGAWGPNTGLEGAAYNWYSTYHKGAPDGSRGVLHGDLPVKVTLYDEAGGVLDTLELTIDNYELHHGYW
ncbi:hypothetical protein [Oscillibacter sp.]|uniref:hypothetical protein n=1 Tax=Oscillibacter sp. TaxID=1945593 RepID=UPI00216F0B93|nr:hypothetical protein [Oscillibacter sp.]MCI8841972.1 hypothetical protein [Oscillibacter sp.]MCI9113164.1 hypothetical protein [Oscillibacter sp.]